MDQKLSALTPRGTPDRAVDQLYIINGVNEYRTTVNNMLGITSQPVGLTENQTLTNKTLTAPTINSPIFGGTITGTYTLGGTVTFPASIVTLTGTQTLTNKTLTSPTITSPTITNANITADAVNGFTTANSGTIYGLAIVAGVPTLPTSTVGRTMMNWPTFSANIKSASNTSAPALTNTSQNLASSGLSLSFTSTGTSYALVTVSLGISSTSDYEFYPEIRLAGVVVASLTPVAALGSASNRANVRGFTYGVTLPSGANVLSAGVTLTAAASPILLIGGGSISAIVLGNVT